ncbi:cyclin dependent protein kinase [Hordeum vulgare]|nr:cyclin dependent protein kinase [Hordeum vulgare]
MPETTCYTMLTTKNLKLAVSYMATVLDIDMVSKVEADVVIKQDSGWTRSEPVWSLSEPAFGPDDGGPVWTGHSSAAVLFSGTRPAMAELGPD